MATASNPYPGLPNAKGMAIEEARRSRIAYRKQADEIQLRFPELSLRIYATPVGMRLIASITYPGERWQRRVETIQEAVWTPGYVDERRVVEWGQRALGAWLAGKVETAVREDGQ